MTMDSLFKTIGSGDHGHPSEDELLLYVDGELAPKASTSLRTHLEACWSCRVRTEKIEDAISTFIDYRNQVLKPLVDPPPYDWRGFDGRLKGLASQVGKPSIFANFRGALGRIFAAPNLSINFRVLMRAVAVTLILALLAAVLIRFNRTSIVSASEMLQRVAAAQQSEIAKTNQAVVYQKLQVRRKAAASSASETVTWEVWNDTVNSRARQSLETATGRRFLRLDAKDTRSDQASPAKISPQQDSPRSLIELNAVLRSNHMNPAMPLSASSYEAWRRSVESKHEEVTKTTTNDGHQALTLHTTPTGQINVGGIAEASLVVRVSDWHPVEERLRVRGEQGEEEFELTETAYSVVSLTALSPEIFAEPVASTTDVAKPETRNSKPETTTPAPNPLPPAPVATTALEIEVLQLLNQVGADVSEQINVTRTPDGLLQVQGIVETEKRKIEIIQALQPVATNPALRIDIQTVAEASQREAQQKSSASAPAVVSRVEVNKGAMPAEADLRRYFSASGGDVDERIRQFASRMINHSQQALFHASALKRLSEKFSDEQLRALDPDAHAKWLAIIRQHARAFQQEMASLRQELRPVFFASMPLGTQSRQSQDSEIRTDAELIEASIRLMRLAATNDRIVRSAFTISAETSVTSAVAAPQFWKSLGDAQSLAAKIGAVVRP